MPAQKIYGYPADNGKTLKDWHGAVIGRGGKQGCTKVAGHQRGGWISSERCSYYFKVDGAWYSCRGRGDGISASCRRMKKDPPALRRPSLSGARRGRLAAPRVTIYEALRTKLRRDPSNAEIKAEVDRIKTEAWAQAAAEGRLPYQRKRRRARR